ncbi:S-layer homology domain-containing protein [Bacillaceae bacterium W0354]
MAYNPKSYRKFMAASASAALVASAVAPAAVAAGAQDDFSDLSDSYRHYDAVNALYNAGVIGGFPDGTFKAEEQIKRGDVALMIFKALELEEGDADALTFEDVPARLGGVVAKLVEEGIVSGYSDEKFGTDELVTRGQVAKMLVEAFNLDLDVEDQGFGDINASATLAPYVNALAAEGITEGYPNGNFGVNDNIKRGDFSKFLADAMGLLDEVTAPAVDEISATNNKEIFVDLTGDVDLEAAEDKDNYTVKNAAGNDVGFSVKVLDGSSVAANSTRVVVQLNSAVKNQDVLTVTVDKAVAGEEVTQKVEFFDTTVPTADSAEALGIRTVKVEFSEPIDAAKFAEKTTLQQRNVFEFVGENVYVVSVDFKNNNREAYITVNTDLEDGDYEVKVNGGELFDYAGYKVAETVVDLTVEEDAEAPKLVGYKNASQKQVTLVFDEPIVPIKGSEYNKASFYHTNSSSINRANSVKEGDAPNELVVTFGDSHLPDGTGYVYVAAESIKDLWNNENVQQLRIAVETEYDEDAPEISNVKLSDQYTLVITFNELLDSKSAETLKNYTLEDSNGNKLELTGTPEYDDKKSVTLKSNDKIEGDLTLTVDKVKDINGNATDELEFKFYGEDVTAPDHEDFEYTLYKSDQKIIVDFNDKAMATDGQYSVVDLSKYYYDGIDLANSKYADYISVQPIDGDTKVAITFDIKAYNKDQKVENRINELFELGKGFQVVSRVADAAGNLSVNITSDKSSGKTLVSNSTVGLASKNPVVATDNDTIVVTLDQAIVDFDAEDYVLYYDYKKNDDETISFGTLSVLNVSLSADGKKLTFLLEDELNDNGKFVVDSVEKTVSVATIGEIESVSQFGDKVSIAFNNANAKAVDAIAPSLAVKDGKYDVSSDGNAITLTFTEDVEASIADAAGSRFVVKDSQGNALTYATGTTPTKENTFTVVLPAEGSAAPTVTIYVYGATDLEGYTVDFASNNYFTDTSGNKVEDFSVTVPKAE